MGSFVLIQERTVAGCTALSLNGLRNFAIGILLTPLYKFHTQCLHSWPLGNVIISSKSSGIFNLCLSFSKSVLELTNSPTLKPFLN